MLINPQNINPVFYERTKDGEVFYDIQSRLIKDRVLFISEPITQENTGTISSLLFMLNHENNEDKISLWLNTPGGDAYGFFAIYDMMQMIQAPVETICVGMAMSAGALIMAAGQKGKRLATPNSKFMIHQLQINLLEGGTATDVEISANNVKKINNDVCEILARHTGNSLEKVKRDCTHDLYLTADEALKYGIIDKIIPMSKQIPKLILKDSDVIKDKATKNAALKKTVRKAVKK